MLWDISKRKISWIIRIQRVSRKSKDNSLLGNIWIFLAVVPFEQCLQGRMGLWQIYIASQAQEMAWTKRQTESVEYFRRSANIKFSSVQCSSVALMSYSLRPHESQHTRPPCPSPSPRVDSNSHPSSRWCHPAISSSVVPFSSCPLSLPASESFPMSQLFAWGGQSTGVSALASFLPKNTQDWSPLEWTGWMSLQSKGLSRVFSNTTVQKHQFFSAQLSSQLAWSKRLSYQEWEHRLAPDFWEKKKKFHM